MKFQINLLTFFLKQDILFSYYDFIIFKLKCQLLNKIYIEKG